MRARIYEQGNGLPDVGDYCAGPDLDNCTQLWLIESIDSRIHTDSPRGNYIFASVELADWDDCDESDEHTALVQVLGDDEGDC